MDAYAGVGGGPFVSGFINGGEQNDAISSVATLANGDLVVCGSVPLSEPWGSSYGVDSVHHGSHDSFIAILDKDMKTVKKFTFLGGPQNDIATDIAVRNDGVIIITGYTESEDLPVTIGAVGPTYSEFIDGFVFGFSSDLEEIVFGSYIVGSGDDIPEDVEVEVDGSIYISGHTTSRTGFPTVNGFDKVHDGGRDGFLMRINPNAAFYQFSTYFGSDGDDVFNDLEINESGSIFLVGTTTSASFPTYPEIPDRMRWWRTRDRPYDWTYGGGNSDATLVIFSQDGAQVIASTYFGGNGEDTGVGIVDLNDELIIVGKTTSTDLEVSGGIQDYLNGTSDAFLARLDSRGRLLTAATYYGGSGDEDVHGAVKYGNQDALIWGTTTSNDFNGVGFGSRGGVVGPQDAFFSVMSLGQARVTSTFGGPALEQFNSCIVEDDGGIILVGTTISPFVITDQGPLVNNGPSQTSDAIAIRYQIGGINLNTPKGGEIMCSGQEISVTWSANDMDSEDEYYIQASRDLEEWTTIAGPFASNSLRITLDDPDMVGTSQYFRALSGRGHASRSTEPVRIDETLELTKELLSQYDMCFGGEVALDIDASGVGLEFVWFKDGRKISGADTKELIVDGNVKGAAGTYKATVFSTCGMTVETECQVVVKTSPDILDQPESTTVNETQTITLRVQSDDPFAVYAWYFNNTLLQDEITNVLRIQSAKLSDAGEYYCITTNDCGEMTSDVATVTVTPLVSVDEEKGISGFSVNILGANPTQATTISLAIRGQIGGTIHIDLVDMAGNVVATSAIAAVADGASYELPISHLPSGRYVVHARNGRAVATETVTILR